MTRLFRLGIDVEVVVDKSQATARYTAATYLANQGVPVRVDYRYAIMHDKFIVVDGETVEEGSFNYTSLPKRRMRRTLSCCMIGCCGAVWTRMAEAVG
jgi:hypothetical protein